MHAPAPIVALLAVFALLALGLAFAQPELRKRPELQRWAAGTWFLLAGLVVLAPPALAAEGFAIVAGNGLVLCGLRYCSHAFHRFVNDADAPPWQRHLVIAGGIALVASVFLPVHARTAVIAAAFAAQVLPPALLIARRGWRMETSLRTAAIMLGSSVAALALRAAYPRDEFAPLFFFLLLGAGLALGLAVLERLTVQMKQLATHDGLTGCVNRVYFEAILNHTLERGRRDRAPVSLLLMDLDRLRQINEHHGPAAGDDVLRAFAQCVRARCRKSDVFGRLGGEEFGLILPVTDVTGALLVAEKVRGATERMAAQAPGAERIQVTASVGVSTAFPQDDLSGNQAFLEAEEALAMAKQRGGNMVVHFVTAVRPAA